jgi:hypothetical protein
VEAHKVDIHRGSHIFWTIGRPLLVGRFLVLVSVKRLSRPQDHSEAGRVRQIEKKSNELIENLTQDLPACSIGPQATTLPRAHNIIRAKKNDESSLKNNVCNKSRKET